MDGNAICAAGLCLSSWAAVDLRHAFNHQVADVIRALAIRLLIQGSHHRHLPGPRGEADPARHRVLEQDVADEEILVLLLREHLCHQTLPRVGEDMAKGPSLATRVNGTLSWNGREGRMIEQHKNTKRRTMCADSPRNWGSKGIM
jgi:hypothetical protein